MHANNSISPLHFHDFLKNLHDGEIDLFRVEKITELRMAEQLVNSILKLPLKLRESWIIELKNLIDALLFGTSLTKLSHDMVEVNRFATCHFDFINLIFVKDVSKHMLLCRSVVPVELYRWESELALLHVVVDLLVEVLAHVRLKNDWEVVPVPLAFAASLLKSG